MVGGKYTVSPRYWYVPVYLNILSVPIAHVANSNRHQRLDDILIIFTLTVQEIVKVVCKKTMSEMHAFITSLCCMKRAHYSKRMLRKHDCVKFPGRIAWQSFCENNFADFSGVVRVKKNQDFVQPLVAFPISNISYSGIFTGSRTWQY